MPKIIVSHPLRADALENRKRILAAAHARFATEGPNAEMDEIARDAGVAVGTLYHHFGAKDALFEAVVEQGLRELEEFVRGLLDEPDAWTAVERLVRYFAEKQVSDRAFSGLIAARPALRATTTATKRSFGPLMTQILDRAKKSGQMRADVAAGDIPLLLAGLGEGKLAAAGQERYVEIVLEGLRTAKA